VQKRPAVNRFDSFLTFFHFSDVKKGAFPRMRPILTIIDFVDDAVAET